MFLEMSSWENMSRQAVCLKCSEQLKSSQTRNTFLGGGSNMFYVHPDLGKMNPFWGAYFFGWVGSTTNQFQRLVRDFIEAVLSKPYD